MASDMDKNDLKIVLVPQLRERFCALVPNVKWLAKIGRSDRNFSWRSKTFWAWDVPCSEVAWKFPFSGYDWTGCHHLITFMLSFVLSNIFAATKFAKHHWKTSGRMAAHKIKRNVKQRPITPPFQYQIMPCISFHPILAVSTRLLKTVSRYAGWCIFKRWSQPAECNDGRYILKILYRTFCANKRIYLFRPRCVELNILSSHRKARWHMMD